MAHAICERALAAGPRMRGIESTTSRRMYASDARLMDNGARYLNKGRRGKQLTTADVVRHMVQENHRLKTRNTYLELRIAGLLMKLRKNESVR